MRHQEWQHQPASHKVSKPRLIPYGCGDLINDYEGIGGHRTYRPQLTALYLPELEAAAGRLRSVVVVPMRVEHFRLNQATDEESDWLADRLCRKSPGTVIEENERGHLMLRAASRPPRV